MSTRARLMAVVILPSLVIGGIFLATKSITDSLKDDALIINLAGRQRMLSQKMMAELLRVARRRAAGDDWQTPATRARNTMEVFSLTLRALRDGDKAPLSLSVTEETKYRECPAATDEVLAQFRVVSKIWEGFSKKANLLLEGNAKSEEPFRKVNAASEELLEEMDKAVVLMQTASERKIKRLFGVHLIGLAVGLISVVCGLFLIDRVFRSLTTANNSLAERIKEIRLVNSALSREIAERKRLEENLHAAVRLLQAVASLSTEEIIQQGLDEAARLSRSQIGYFHFVNSDQKSIRLQTWSSETSKHCSVDKREAHYPIDKAGVWVDCVRHKRPVIHNDYESLPHKGGLPKGHVPVVREMAIPVFEKGKIVAILGVGNKADDYTQFDIEQLTLFAEKIWSAVQRRRAEEELHRHQKHLEERVQERTRDLAAANESLQKEIKERKSVEENQQRLATAIEQAAETVVLTDANGTIEYVNPAFERITGYSRSEVLGGNPRALRSGKHDDKFYSQLWGTIKRGEVWKGRFTNKHKNGTLYEEEATISPICASKNRITGYVAVKRDVTYERDLESRLRQSQKMEAIGTLAGGIAHDFNNILTAIIGFSELAVSDIPQNSPATAKLNEVLKSGKRATDLVKQILTFSRQTEQKRVSMCLHSVVKEALNLLRGSLPSTIEICQNINPSCRSVFADPTEIHQVVMNLCTNAYHAMREQGGVLNIELEETDSDREYLAHCSDQEPEAYVRLTISDTGHGMNEEIKQHVFEPYFTTKEVGDGTGLGLATVHGIVESHDGTISVFSEPGKGTTFKVLLPVCSRPPKPNTQKGGDPLPEKGSERILFVDDEILIIEAQRITLERHGYIVTAFANSEKALRSFVSDPYQYDVIITDQTMPKMTGYELAIRAMEVRPDIPVIMCTGFSDMVNEKKAKSVGIRKFINKPVSGRDLAKTVRHIMNEPALSETRDKHKVSILTKAS